MCTSSSCRCGYPKPEDKLEECPFCGWPACEADWVDIGVGEVQCGPYHCTECGASQIGPECCDEGWKEPEGAKKGWYPPQHPPSSYANTYKGKIVNHKQAEGIYRKACVEGRNVRWEGTLREDDEPHSDCSQEGDADA